MGAHLDKPVVEKETERSEGSNGLCFGGSAMQGWRQEMEDTHTIVASLGGSLADYSWVAVYDGHGGKETAILAA